MCPRPFFTSYVVQKPVEPCSTFATHHANSHETTGPRVGPGPTDDKETIVLGRIIRWTSEGTEYEADPRQVEKLLMELDLDGDGVKGVVTPAVKVLSHQAQSEKELPESEHIRFRGLISFQG